MSLKIVAPTLLGYRLPFPGDEGRGATYCGAASMFWLLGEPRVQPAGHRPSTKLAVLSQQEKSNIAASLAETLDRVTYYRQRFDDAVVVLIERKRKVGGTVTYDAFGSQLYDLLGFILTAARSFIDLIVYVSARLVGKSEKYADRWGVEEMKKAATPEGGILTKHGLWFDVLNSYRNALIHRGHRRSFGGYFARNCMLDEARIPKYNVMLIPDYASIQRPNRPHQWTYNQGSRIEDLVTNICEGLDAFALDIGHHWGGSVPSDSEVPDEEHPNLLVVVQKPAFMLAHDTAIWPIFTERYRAEQFHRKSMNGATQAEPFEVSICHQPEEPAFVFSLAPSNVEQLKAEGIKRVWMVLDPDPERTDFHDFLIKDIPIAEFDVLELANDTIHLLAKSFPDIETLFMIRTVPEYLNHQT